jgi:hypothetical protein
MFEQIELVIDSMSVNFFLQNISVTFKTSNTNNNNNNMKKWCVVIGANSTDVGTILLSFGI